MFNHVAVDVSADLNPNNTGSEALVTQCAVCKVDLRGRFVYVDKQVEQMLGLYQEDLFGREFREFVEECQHPVIDRLFTRHSRFETIFETADILLYDREGHPVPVSVIASLNFVAGNPVNFQIVLQPIQNSPSQIPQPGAPADRWSPAASVLTALGDETGWSDAVVGLRDLSDAREVLVYRLTDDHPLIVCSSADPASERPHPVFSGDLNDVHLDVALNGGTYDFCDSEHVRRAVEQHGVAPSEFVTIVDRGEQGRFMIRLAFDENDTSGAAKAGIDRARLLLQRHIVAAPVSPLRDNSTESTVSTVVPDVRSQWLGQLGIAACLIEHGNQLVTVTDPLRRLCHSEEAPKTVESLVDAVLSPGNDTGRRLVNAAVRELLESGDAAEYDADITLRDGSEVRLVARRSDAESGVWLTMVAADARNTATSSAPLAPVDLVQQAESLISKSAQRMAAIGHGLHKAMDIANRIELAAALDELRAGETALRFIRQVQDYLSKNETPAAVDLNLVVTGIFEHLRRALPDRQVNLSFSDLPTVVTLRSKMTDLLTAWIFCLAGQSSEKTASVTITASTPPGRVAVQLLAAACAERNFERGPGAITWPGFDSGTADIPGALWFITTAVASSLQGSVSLCRDNPGEARLCLEFPDNR